MINFKICKNISEINDLHDKGWDFICGVDRIIGIQFVTPVKKEK